MTVKVKYENGVLMPIKKVKLENHKIYEIDIKQVEEKKVKYKGIKANAIKELIGIISIGGDALEDSEKIYDK